MHIIIVTKTYYCIWLYKFLIPYFYIVILEACCKLSVTVVYPSYRTTPWSYFYATTRVLQ